MKFTFQGRTAILICTVTFLITLTAASCAGPFPTATATGTPIFIAEVKEDHRDAESAQTDISASTVLSSLYTTSMESETEKLNPPETYLQDLETTPLPETDAPETAPLPETDAPETAPLPEPMRSARTSNGTKIAYLTFDDGPDKNNTGNLLEILDNYGVKATFFVVGNRAELYPDTLKDIRDGGHALGCHTYDHKYDRSSTADGIESEIIDWEAAVGEILGEVPPEKLFRFPGGSPVDDVNNLKDTVDRLGYRGYDWNCLNNDCLIIRCPPDMDQQEWLKNSFLETYKYGSSLKNSPLIILMHDTYPQSAEMLGWVIEFLQSEGYSFETLEKIDGSWYY